jgi:hypothetical protein
MKIVECGLRILEAIFGHEHEWTWPLKPRDVAGRLMRRAPSYQRCTVCGRKRINTLLDGAGPVNLETQRRFEWAS